MSSIGLLGENEVAQLVTWRLEQPLMGSEKMSGWLYVIRPHNLPGQFKIGFTEAYPEQVRFKTHQLCYGEFEIIKMKFTPHGKRVETLLLDEFKNHYKLHDCPRCKRRHHGLLGIDEKSLLSSFKKWIQFVKYPSYNHRSGKLLPGVAAILPPPASRDYLGCKRPRVPANPTLRQEAGSQDTHVILPKITHEEGNQATAGIPKGYRLKDSERDSGYASASRPATLAVPSESAFRDDIKSPAARKLDETSHSYNNDILSLASDNDDIGSQVSNETTYQEMTGKALIRVFLSEDTDFRSICEKAMGHMGRQRFVENLRRLLKSFHKNLAAEAEAEAEKAVARLLRSRRGRLWISEQLALCIQQEQEETREGHRVDTQVAPEDKHRIETWLRTLTRAVDPEEFEDLNVNDESGTSDSDDGFARDEFPFISELETFLRRAKSFRTLLKDFMLMFLPTELRHVLLSIPKEQIWVEQEQDISPANRVKAWVEDSTQVRWNWWPLEPRKRMLREGESRLFWRCVSFKSPCAHITLNFSRHAVRGSGKKYPPNNTS